jgi:peptidoglycan/LPS O-acetylase OafA/YrhL
MKMNKSNYLQGLNGIRAIAALLVLLSHIYTADYGFNGGAKFFINLSQGAVTMFFVLSGFIITYLIFATENRVNIKKFYIRRILRIWPIYYLVLFIGLYFNYRVHEPNVFYAPYFVFLMANIPFVLGKGLPLISHLWSIGVEEQFYVFYPWVVLLKRNIHNFVLFFLIITLFVIKIVAGFCNPDSFLYHFLQVSRFDCMLIGALGASLFLQNNTMIFRCFDNRISQILAWCLFFILSLSSVKICRPFIQEVISVVTLCIIIGQIRVSRRVFNLERKPMVFLGKISYGIYIYHPLVISFCIWLSKQPNWNSLYKHIFVFVLSILLTPLLATVSYYCYEKYFLNLKQKFV